VDFAHLHARAGGKNNSYKEFAESLEMIGKKLGDDALKDIHIHMSGIEYSDKGERKHLKLDESDMNYKELMKALKDYNVAGTMICESPVLEEDALIMKAHYESL
jgi:deoxyribonuclease-4